MNLNERVHGVILAMSIPEITNIVESYVHEKTGIPFPVFLYEDEDDGFVELSIDDDTLYDFVAEHYELDEYEDEAEILERRDALQRAYPMITHPYETISNAFAEHLGLKDIDANVTRSYDSNHQYTYEVRVRGKHVAVLNTLKEV